MGICSSSSSKKFKRFLRCSKCQARNKRQRRQENEDFAEEEIAVDGSGNEHVHEHIKHAFYSLADDPVFISQKRFIEELGQALSLPLWRFLQGDEEKTISLKRFEGHAKFLKEMPVNTYAQMDMRPDQLLQACLETCEIMPSNESPGEIEFMRKLSEQMGNTPEAIIAWKERNCPRLFQSIHEHVLSVFLCTPKSPIEESKMEESSLLNRTQMFFLKHNLPREVFFDKGMASAGIEEEEECGLRREISKGEESQQMEEPRRDWVKLYESASQGLDAEQFQSNLFKFNGSTVVIFQMSCGEIFVLAVDEQWKNSPRPFGGPYTVLFKFHPEFQRFEVGPPALHCNFANPQTDDALFFDGGTIFCMKSDLSNVKAIEAWGCATFRTEEQKISTEAQAILERRKPADEANRATAVGTNEDGKKVKGRSAVNEWEENPDKELLEMAGISSSDKRRRRK